MQWFLRFLCLGKVTTLLSILTGESVQLLARSPRVSSLTVDRITPEQLAKLCQVVVGRFSGLLDSHLGLARTYHRQDSSICDSVHGYKLFCSPFLSTFLFFVVF